MRKTTIYLSACVLSGLMLATSCQDNLEMEATHVNTRSVSLDKDIFAVKGCIHLKLAASAQQTAT